VVTWIRQRIAGVVNHWVETGIGIGAVALGLYLWHERDRVPSDVTLPTWVLVLAIAVPLLLLVVWVVQGVRAMNAADETVAFLNDQLLLTAYYSRHLYDSLEAWQKIQNGAIPDVDGATFLEQGVLQPARDFLMQRPGEDVRLSILVPSGDDFEMALAAGHTLESKMRYRLPIAHSFSKAAYESGRIEWSGDLDNDPRFTPHPRAREGRGYDSIISSPVRAGDETVAVFNVISTFKDAFGPADFLYVALLGAIVNVVWPNAGIPGASEGVDGGETDK
jgi:hypothetical protein